METVGLLFALAVILFAPVLVFWWHMKGAESDRDDLLRFYDEYQDRVQR